METRLERTIRAALHAIKIATQVDKDGLSAEQAMGIIAFIDNLYYNQ
mgnify:CR=1 FL=1